MPGDSTHGTSSKSSTRSSSLAQQRATCTAAGTWTKISTPQQTPIRAREAPCLNLVKDRMPEMKMEMGMNVACLEWDHQEFRPNQQLEVSITSSWVCTKFRRSSNIPTMMTFDTLNIIPSKIHLMKHNRSTTFTLNIIKIMNGFECSSSSARSRSRGSPTTPPPSSTTPPPRATVTRVESTIDAVHAASMFAQARPDATSTPR